MKKTLLFIAILSGYVSLNAQALMTENFNSLTVGNVGTDITGATPGQGGLNTFTPAGANTNFTIYNEGGTYANALQIAGPTNATDTRYVWKNGLNTAWTSRTTGNNIIEIEYDFYTGAATTSKSTTGIRLFNAAGQTMAGFRFVPETKVITGLARYNNAGTIGTYFFNLGAANAVITLLPNTWYRIGFAFNKTTGEIIWKGTSFNASIIGTEIGVDPDEADFLVVAGTANTVSTIARFDGLTIKATATEGLLSVKDFEKATANSISVYPNPVKDIFTLSTSNGIKVASITIIDINGRTVKNIKTNNLSKGEFNISDLSAGVYLVDFETDKGMVTKKMIKS